MTPPITELQLLQYLRTPAAALNRTDAAVCTLAAEIRGFLDALEPLLTLAGQAQLRSRRWHFIGQAIDEVRRAADQQKRDPSTALESAALTWRLLTRGLRATAPQLTANPSPFSE